MKILIRIAASLVVSTVWPRQSEAKEIESKWSVPSTITITIPGRESKTISMAVHASPMELQGDRLLPEYERLRDAAIKHDSAAAEALYRALQYCEKAYGDAATLEAAVGVARRDRFIQMADGSQPYFFREGEDIEALIESLLREPYMFCEGITADDRAKANYWLELAVSEGDYFALRARAELLSGSPEELAAWRTVWSRGSFGALESLARLLAKDSEHQSDRVRAFAHLYLHSAIFQAVWSNPESPIQTRARSRVQARLETAARMLTKQEHDEAMSLAYELLSNNQNCCFLN